MWCSTARPIAQSSRSPLRGDSLPSMASEWRKCSACLRAHQSFATAETWMRAVPARFCSERLSMSAMREDRSPLLIVPDRPDACSSCRCLLAANGVAGRGANPRERRSAATAECPGGRCGGIVLMCASARRVGTQGRRLQFRLCGLPWAGTQSLAKASLPPCVLPSIACPAFPS